MTGMKTNSVSAIIPFYNEENRILAVLEVLQETKSIDEIICVDDGSTDRALEIIGMKYQQITLLQHPCNQGKSAAIATGVSRAKGTYILLLDADISNLRADELETAITKAKQAHISMLILRRVHDPWTAKITRGDTLLSGERILRKSDLVHVLQTNPRHYQIETAINLYMMKQKKQVYWFPQSGINCHKIKKKGTLKGLLEEIRMNYSMYAFAGFFSYLKLVACFCKKRIE